MSWSKRLWVLSLLVGASFLLAATAYAEVTITPEAQEAFGIDENGVPTGDASGTLAQGWRLFWEAPEGQRIFTFADGVETEFVIEVGTEAEVGKGTALGTARVLERNEAGIPTRIRLQVRTENAGGRTTVADTIWHEFRHGEIFVSGDREHAEEHHDELDGEGSELNEKFRSDVDRITGRDADLIRPDTPHYDRIMRDAFQRDLMRRSSILFGDILGDIRDSISFNDATFSDGYVDIELYGVNSLDYTVEGVTLTFNESAFECGERSETRIVACSDDGVLDMAAGRVVFGVMILAEDIPLTGDVSLIYSLVADSDGDDGNDWVPVPPFDWDQFQDTDRWYQLFYDHLTDTWSLTVTQLDARGAQPGVGEPSSVRVVVEGDTVVFFVSATEFPHARPGVRLTSFGHDGMFSESFRGGDVSQIDPTFIPAPIPEGALQTAVP